MQIIATFNNIYNNVLLSLSGSSQTCRPYISLSNAK